MQMALDDAGLDAAGIDAMIAHATGTPKGDTAEINAINIVHGDRANPLPVSSIKGHIGHSGSSSGAMAVVNGLMAMAEGRFSLIANTDEPDPEARFDIVHGQSRELNIQTLQVNTFGFGGQNASIVLTRT